MRYPTVDLLNYSGFLVITLIFLLFTVRIFFYALIKRTDPIKAVIPRFPEKKEKINVEQMS
jgi:hypothetical protein